MEVSVVAAANQPVPAWPVKDAVGHCFAGDDRSSGRARFTGLTPNRYEISPTKDGFPTGIHAGQSIDHRANPRLMAHYQRILTPYASVITPSPPREPSVV